MFLKSLFQQLEVKKHHEKPVIDILLSRLPVMILKTAKRGKWIFIMDIEDAVLFLFKFS